MLLGRQAAALVTASFAPPTSVYLLYWYKRTNTDAKGAAREAGGGARHCLLRASDISLLYWYKRTNTDAKGAAREAGGGARHCLLRASDIARVRKSVLPLPDVCEEALRGPDLHRVPPQVCCRLPTHADVC
jgi:hypothetical protein